MHTRGSGFSDFSYTTLTLGLLVILLPVPSLATRITSLIIAVILLVGVILIVSVPRLRLEEGWVGVASVAWTLFIGIWAILADRVIAWGKREEEVRLTGREETRRTLLEWCSVLTSTIVLIVLALVTILLTATLIFRSRDASLPAPGERYYVDGDQYQIHVFCAGNTTDSRGKKSPTVLFEAGDHPFGHGLSQVATNALSNGSIGPYCYADRP